MLVTQCQTEHFSKGQTWLLSFFSSQWARAAAAEQHNHRITIIISSHKQETHLAVNSQEVLGTSNRDLMLYPLIKLIHLHGVRAVTQDLIKHGRRLCFNQSWCKELIKNWRWLANRRTALLPPLVLSASSSPIYFINLLSSLLHALLISWQRNHWKQIMLPP